MKLRKSIYIFQSACIAVGVFQHKEPSWKWNHCRLGACGSATCVRRVWIRLVRTRVFWPLRFHQRVEAAAWAWKIGAFNVDCLAQFSTIYVFLYQKATKNRNQALTIACDFKAHDCLLVYLRLFSMFYTESWNMKFVSQSVMDIGGCEFYFGHEWLIRDMRMIAFYCSAILIEATFVLHHVFPLYLNINLIYKIISHISFLVINQIIIKYMIFLKNWIRQIIKYNLKPTACNNLNSEE
jgi:hypothetical protein